MLEANYYSRCHVLIIRLVLNATCILFTVTLEVVLKWPNNEITVIFCIK